MRTRLIFKEALTPAPVAPLANSSNPEVATVSKLAPGKAQLKKQLSQEELDKKGQEALAQLSQIRATLSAMVLKSIQLNKLIKPDNAAVPPTVTEAIIPPNKAKELTSFVKASIQPRVRKEAATGNPQAPQDQVSTATKKKLIRELLADIKTLEGQASALEALLKDLNKTIIDPNIGASSTAIGTIPVSLNQAEKIMTSILLGNKEVTELQAFKELLNGIDSSAGKLVQAASLLGGLPVAQAAIKK